MCENLIERLQLKRDVWRGTEFGDDICELLDEAAAALEAAWEDAEKWRKCNTTHDIGDGERIECHVIVGVNVYDEKGWLCFEQTTPDEFFKTLDAIDQSRGKGVACD